MARKADGVMPGLVPLFALVSLVPPIIHTCPARLAFLARLAETYLTSNTPRLGQATICVRGPLSLTSNSFALIS